MAVLIQFIFMLLPFFLTYNVVSCKLSVSQTNPWQVFASKILSLKCSDYVSGTERNDSFEWTGNYVFETKNMDRLAVPVKTKWRNVGKIMVICTVKRPGHPNVQAQFSVTFEPLTINSSFGRGSPGYITTYFLIIVGVSAALSILCCTLLLVRKLRKSARRYMPKLELLSEVACSRLPKVEDPKSKKPYKPYTISSEVVFDENPETRQNHAHTFKSDLSESLHFNTAAKAQQHKLNVNSLQANGASMSDFGVLVPRKSKSSTPRKH